MGCASKDTFQTFGSADGKSDEGGVCSAFPRAEYQIKGKTKYDQEWADATIEAEIAGCGFARPARRPEGMDPKQVASATVTPATQDVGTLPPFVDTPKKLSVWQKTKAKAKLLENKVKNKWKGIPPS